MATAYQQAQREGQGVVRTAILDTATRLLVTEGPGALTVRRIAGEAGCSTKVIYTLFGGKDGLVEALWLEGFARFERRLRAGAHRHPLANVLADPPADPLADLRAGLDSYREYALAEPDYYRVMFQGAVPGFSPGPEAVAAARRAFDLLVHAVRACLEQGLLRGGTAREIADLLWMAVHGAVSLEITGFFAPPESAGRYRALYSAVLAPFLLPPGLPDDELGEPGGEPRELPYEESAERTAS
ncbi:Transcriptional regulator, TetR family [Nonomuraea coxensis DSM 45129]|uniref:Transcriptional regulator, TetR family n=1 Tax=Nonomuraea coxensis DSM 45129 TaxID=1122611 RepID=A0ABX8TZB0_9ACTN|nr:TetR/AcrR family transcriptional regulator [Nonomuraea coxensis]QYC40821.1 Transcriptional regulator, TetR family [Nonomuraea coxensis DSM 45129]